jgi:hypothetical protein
LQQLLKSRWPPSLTTTAGQRREPPQPPHLAATTDLIRGVTGGSHPRPSDEDGEETERQQSPDLAWKDQRTPRGKTPTTGTKAKTTPSIYTTKASAFPQVISTGNAGENGLGSARDLESSLRYGSSGGGERWRLCVFNTVHVVIV